MDFDKLVSELQSAIRKRDDVKVQNLLGPIHDGAVIKVIDDKFFTTVVDSSDKQIDPVNYAIEFRTEKIAIYLVEKSFPTDRLYQQESLQCDQWCYFDHGNDRCPAQWDAADNAGYAGFYNLKNLIESIRTGKRKPGQGLSSPFIQDSNKSEKMEPVKQEKQGMPIYQAQRASDVEEARKVLDEYGKNYVSKEGNTLFHCYITKPKVYFYVFAAGGVPVNIQNSDGDTALHLAVRAGSVDAVEALLQCCADPTVRNKMGQTPLEMSDNAGITALINKFKPGVVFSICNDKAQVLDRVLKNTWCCLETVVKEGKTAIELAECKVMEGKGEKCLNVLKSYRKTSQLILAVLCHDVETTRKLLEREKLPVNIRFRDRLGKTLLSHCIEQRNLELVKLLMEYGAKVNQIRVRQDEEADVTVPLFHKCLCDNECLDIAKYLNPLMDPSEHKEKDQAGNTPLLSAIENGLSIRYIQWLIQATRGFALVDRNSDGLTAKELAMSKGSTEVVKIIDKFILKSVFSETGVPTLLPQFAINFSREEDIAGITDESSNKSLKELLRENDKYNLKKWLNFDDVFAYAERVMKAASGDGGLTVVQKLYDAHYRDRNGFTAMTRAVAFQQYDIIEYLCTTRPALKTLPDNNNRYPLHYAFALPEPESKKVRDLLLEKNPQDQEKKMDKDGLFPADYAPLRDSLKVMKILYDARTLNVYAQRGPPLGRWPVGARKDDPDEE